MDYGHNFQWACKMSSDDILTNPTWPPPLTDIIKMDNQSIFVPRDAIMGSIPMIFRYGELNGRVIYMGHY